MNLSKNFRTYTFNFDNSVNENLPLSYNVLQHCKIKIQELESLGIYSSTESFKVDLSSNIDVKNDNYLLNLSSRLVSLFITQFNYKKNNILLNIEHKLHISATNKNINSYYIINNKLYLYCNESLNLVDSLKYKNLDLNNKTFFKNFFNYKKNILNSYLNFNIFKIIDKILIQILLSIHLTYIKLKFYNRFDFRLKQTSWGFYVNKLNNSTINLFSGASYLWKGLRFWLVSLILGWSSIYYLIYIRLLPFNKILFSWILICMFLYWLLSGFVFFVKKYQYSRFTSVIQRFWKRTYVIFWLIEFSTFSVFLYLTLNASAEPVYMYDQIKIYKTHLFSWRYFLPKLIPAVAIILLGYYLLLTLKWNLFNKQSTVLIIITLLLLYTLWLEFYQFFHLINFYGNINWSFDYDEYIWSLDIDSRRTRLSNNYITFCMILKFWHFVFIFIFWVFFVLRINEIGRIRYPLLVANVQNFIIIYMMSWVYMYPWFKFIFRKFMDVPYYWFYLNGRDLGLRVFFTDIKLFYYGFTNNIYFFVSQLNITRYPFFYWINSSPLVSYDQYRKSIIRDSIINSFNNYII